jgi:hypothetical protein
MWPFTRSKYITQKEVYALLGEFDRRLEMKMQKNLERKVEELSGKADLRSYRNTARYNNDYPPLNPDSRIERIFPEPVQND